jgi:malonyl-CoA O-methyltransferase
VIDIGCADGLVLEKIAAKTRGRLLGLDIAESHVTYNRGAYTHQADWLVADGATLPVRDNAFDVAVLGEILEHVIDPAAVLAEAERVVKPGGRVIVSTPIEGMALDQHGAEHRDGLHGFPVDLHVREFDPGVELRGRTNLELAQSFILTLTGQIVPGFYLASYTI